MASNRVRVLFWGSYDLGKPRTRILLRGLRDADVQLIECHSDVWRGIPDKSRIRGWRARIWAALRWLSCYPRLVARYLRQPEHDVVLVGYLGHLDVLVLWPLAKLAGKPVVWDVFLSLYNTVVEDRRLIGESHPLARLLFGVEWLACRAADLLVLDTQQHAAYFVERYGIAAEKTAAVFVGADPDAFPRHLRQESSSTARPFTVLFYGTFIPLHGVETIVRAAGLTRDVDVDWVLIGQGQDEARIREMLDADPPLRVKMIAWKPYTEEFVHAWMCKADVCLGLFGDSEKAGRVIPNKVFQIISVGKPLITRDSPAVREFVNPEMAGVYLVPPSDPKALAEAVRQMATSRGEFDGVALHGEVAPRILPGAIGAEFARLMEKVLRQGPVGAFGESGADKADGAKIRFDERVSGGAPGPAATRQAENRQ